MYNLTKGALFWRVPIRVRSLSQNMQQRNGMVVALAEGMTHGKGIPAMNPATKKYGSILTNSSFHTNYNNEDIAIIEDIFGKAADTVDGEDKKALKNYYAVNKDITKTGTPIQDFYKGAVIFITGGTGFLGKILLNKLLTSCPDIETIYLLVRNKKDKDIHTRLDEIFDDPVFEEMKVKVPKYRHKVEVLQGDTSAAGLGLSDADKQTLTKKVNVVFHSAATVRFYERLDIALSTNVDAIHSILDLCKNMKNLKSLVHVSTAYTNCHRQGPVKECIYEYNVTYEDVKNKISKMDHATIEKVTPNILGPWPNVYSFTKALAEASLRKKSKGLPIGVFRPAIVTPSYKEPVEGWMDNTQGTTAYLVAASTGLLRTLHCDGDLNISIVPVDMCVNALIASAWDIANNCKNRSSDSIPVYNYVSSENPLTWKEYFDLNSTYGFKYPLGSAEWYYGLTLNRSRSWHRVHSLLYHYIPATIVDGVSICTGQKPKMLKKYKKIHNIIDAIAYFATHDWKFSNDNVRSMWKKLEKKDRDLFPFSIKDVDWVQYFSTYLKGIRTYVFKEKVTQEEAVRKWKRLYIYHITLKTIALSTISYGLCFPLFKILF